MGDRLYGNKTWDMILRETVASITKLCDTKGDEYKASGDDQLANFRRRAERLGLPIEAIWAVYAGKHWDALETYVKDLTENRTRQRSEPLEGRVDDVIVYLILFKAMLAEREAGETVALQKCANCGREQRSDYIGCHEMGSKCPFTTER